MLAFAPPPRHRPEPGHGPELRGQIRTRTLDTVGVALLIVVLSPLLIVGALRWMIGR